MRKIENIIRDYNTATKTSNTFYPYVFAKILNPSILWTYSFYNILDLDTNAKDKIYKLLNDFGFDYENILYRSNKRNNEDNEGILFNSQKFNNLKVKSNGEYLIDPIRDERLNIELEMSSFDAELIMVSIKHDMIIFLHNHRLYIYYNSKNEISNKLINDIYEIYDNHKKIVNPYRVSLLVSQHNGFYKEEVDAIKPSYLVNYNPKDFINDDFDFELVDSLIKSEKSELIIFYGEAGTGKTTYIKHLISKHNDLEFIFITPDIARNLDSPNFISFLINNCKNTIFVIEEAEKLVVSREDNANSSVGGLLNATDGILSDIVQIKFILTFNTSVYNIDKALLRPGRLSYEYSFGKLHRDKVNKLFPELTESMTVAEMFNANRALQKKKNKIGF